MMDYEDYIVCRGVLDLKVQGRPRLEVGVFLTPHPLPQRKKTIISLNVLVRICKERVKQNNTSLGRCLKHHIKLSHILCNLL